MIQKYYILCSNYQRVCWSLNYQNRMINTRAFRFWMNVSSAKYRIEKIMFESCLWIFLYAVAKNRTIVTHRGFNSCWCFIILMFYGSWFPKLLYKWYYPLSGGGGHEVTNPTKCSQALKATSWIIIIPNQLHSRIPFLRLTSQTAFYSPLLFPFLRYPYSK